MQNRTDDHIRISLVAVDTHGFTSVAMAIAKLLGFDLCARLRNLRERKLFMPRSLPVPEALEAVTVRGVSLTAIERGWDDPLRMAASIRTGKVAPALAIERLDSAAIGDPRHRAAEHLGRLLRTLFLCHYLAIEDFRRQIHTLLNRGESVHHLQAGDLHRFWASPRKLTRRSPPPGGAQFAIVCAHRHTDAFSSGTARCPILQEACVRPLLRVTDRALPSRPRCRQSRGLCPPLQRAPIPGLP